MKDISEYPDAHLRIFDRKPAPRPDAIRSVHFIGICGTGMGSLAGLMKDAGYNVRGSDAAVYPPMSTRLEELGISLIEGFSTDNLQPEPDVVIVGNACTPTHVEAAFAREQNLVQLSFPEALAHFFLKSKRSLVVAGTHGKTTTTGMLSHILVSSGADPGFLVGGVMQNGNVSYRIGSGTHFVVEGDEYDSAYFDKRPKFMHYGPAAAIVTSLEFDHADIYDNVEDYREAFEQFAESIEPEGVLVLNAEVQDVLALENRTQARVLTYSTKGREIEAERSVDVWAENPGSSADGIRFDLVAAKSITGREIRERIFLPMTGDHNLSNALAASAVALHEGITPKEIAEAFSSFRGLKRRQEIVAEIDGVTIIDDFAHHPTAVRETIYAIKDRWPGRRIVSVFEPRSNSSRRKVFESSYVDAFLEADAVFISSPPFRHNDDPSNFMDVNIVTARLMGAGIDARSLSSHSDLKDVLADSVESGDVVLIMSNGGFGGIHGWLEDELRSRIASG
ncbi:MAG: UDP-N-acetylmuramate:L-alanyl-gamma-D-glutamyl-meso-diaminopimelate ligase [Rhodothermales bacterium]|nr:UDP-N-acetylmuramate:L-alanyl-gamma-D-glutamyl-meso-diaminopimelate ligase [Rhodothermales bacterium]